LLAAAARRARSGDTARQLTIEHESSDGGHLLRLAGELDIATASRLETLVSELCADGARRIELDLSRLTFIDSAGLRAVLVAADRCADSHSALELVRSEHPAARRVFELAGLADRILPWRAP
jgi:stage II sporulation protein AA (anti-sigma F factor antagonist)